MAQDGGRMKSEGRSRGTGGPGQTSGTGRSDSARGGSPKERDGTDSLLAFLGRLSRFGLSAGSEPLLKSLKRAT